MMKDSKTKISCNSCRFLKKFRVRSSEGKDFYNLYCTNNQNNVSKLIDVSVEANKEVNGPKWCPIIERCPSLQEHISNTTTQSRAKKTWRDLTSQVELEDLKVGDIYHIPPFEGQDRKDIEITYRTEYSASYRVLNDASSSGVVNTLFKGSVLLKALTTHKIQKIRTSKKV